MACVCLHNYLCTVRSETYVPPAYADWEDGNGKNGNKLPFQTTPAHNPHMAAKEVWDMMKKYLVSPAGRVP